MERSIEQINTDERLDSLERWREEFEVKFKAAFAGGDHVGHSRYHELMIEDIQSRKRLRQAVLEKTIGGLILGTVGISCAAAWYAFVEFIRSIGKGP